MRRRDFLGAASALALPSMARAQRSKIPTLGLLYPNPSSGPQGKFVTLVAAQLKQLGWIVGDNLAVEDASGEGQEDRMPALAAVLVEKKVDVIWVAGPEAAIAAARATRTIPIAFYGVGYPVAQGLVDSLAQPGRNVTGIASFAGSERAKTVELLREIAPKSTRLAWIGVETVGRTLAGGEINLGPEQLAVAAAKSGFEYRRHPVARREDFDAAFAGILGSRAQALGADFTALTVRERQRIVNFASQHRLPSAFGASVFVEAGGLLSYGASRDGMFAHSFTFVDRILRGARPAELPVEMPRTFELAFNSRSARMLGLTIPQSLLLRADRVIE